MKDLGRVVMRGMKKRVKSKGRGGGVVVTLVLVLSFQMLAARHAVEHIGDGHDEHDERCVYCVCAHEAVRADPGPASGTSAPLAVHELPEGIDHGLLPTGPARGPNGARAPPVRAF